MRRIVCRVVGHRWINVRTWDPNTWPSWWCQHCHTEREREVR